MSNIQEVQVTIGADGTVEVHVTGAKGDTCLELTKRMEQYLGGRVTERELTAEFDAVREIETAGQEEQEELGADEA